MSEEHKIWQRAKVSTIGIEIVVDDAKLGIQKLYQARQELADPELAMFEIRRTDVANKIFIVRVKRDG